MAVRRSTTATKAPPRAGGRGAIVWLALGWMIFVAWLALLALNAAPYLGGRSRPPASDLPGRLVALPTALPLPGALAAPAAWTIAALALFIGVITAILTFSHGPHAATVAPTPTTKPVRPPAPEPASQPAPSVSLPVAPLAATPLAPMPSVPEPSPIAPPAVLAPLPSQGRGLGGEVRASSSATAAATMTSGASWSGR